MPGCTDSLCKDCFKSHFSIAIKEKTVKHFNCPICDLPDMTNRDGAQDLYQEMFVHLVSDIFQYHDASILYYNYTCRYMNTFQQSTMN